MPIHQELLEILACPVCKAEVNLIPLPEEVCRTLEAKYKPKFGEEDPIVKEGLQCKECKKVYPIVSDIPVMLIEEAITL